MRSWKRYELLVRCSSSFPYFPWKIFLTQYPKNFIKCKIQKLTSHQTTHLFFLTFHFPTFFYQTHRYCKLKKRSVSIPHCCFLYSNTLLKPTQAAHSQLFSLSTLKYLASMSFSTWIIIAPDNPTHEYK